MPELEPSTDHTHLVDNGKVQLTLDELAAIQPGMSRLMVEVSDRMWKCFHAGMARNRAVARYQLSQAVKILKASVVVRPRYTASMRTFLDEEMTSLRQVIEHERWEDFEGAFADLVAATKRYHEEFDKGYLVWKVSPEPPGDLDLTPRG